MSYTHLINEQEVISTINKIANKLADGYTFGIYDVDDIRQEIYLIVFEKDKKGNSVLDRWDGVRSLYKFLSQHIKNRLNNLKRNKWFRASCPCTKCDSLENGNTKHKNKQHCKKYIEWKKRNSVKANLAGPSQLSDEYDVAEGIEQFDIFISQELVDYIDGKLDIVLRPYYLKMRSGVYVQDKYRNKVIVAVKKILAEYNKD